MLCPICKKELSVDMFETYKRIGGFTTRNICKKCKWAREKARIITKKEKAGTLFDDVRRIDPARADRLDAFRQKAKNKLPM